MFAFKLLNVPHQISIYDILFELTYNSDVNFYRIDGTEDVLFEFMNLRDMINCFELLNGKHYIYGDNDFIELIYEVFDDIKAICSDTDILDLKIVIKKLTYLLPALNLNTLINKFNLLQQNSSESFMLWYIRVSKLHKKCNFLDDSRLKEKLRTSTLNDKIKYKFSKNLDLTLNQMVELGVKLDSSNIKYNYGNNNSRYHDNYNNYNYNNYRYNNNNQSNFGRNNTWYDYNQRKQIQYGDGNRNNYQSYYNNSDNYRGNDKYQRKQIQYNNNSNNYRGNDNIQRKQIQYNNNSNNYRSGDENNKKQIQYNNDYNMNIEEIIEEKVDSTKNKDDNDFNVNLVT
ncbi:probable ATP-dependent RNA helicase ddx42 [Gordionus sp. m RMFG-2023]|uniref:probable ATP-dependent RNA helicase ddx42 n=1 Tax=Gordionus sp. m RMFG-2023 TaxID=3053472 RepID=UPI0031FC0B0C